MKKAGYHFYIIGGYFGLFMLFLLNLCYIFTAIGLLALGLIAVPSVLLGTVGVLTIISDIAELPMLMISGGVLLLGFGMCTGIFALCPASVNLLHRFRRQAYFRRKRAYDE